MHVPAGLEGLDKQSYQFLSWSLQSKLCSESSWSSSPEGRSGLERRWVFKRAWRRRRDAPEKSTRATWTSEALLGDGSSKFGRSFSASLVLGLSLRALPIARLRRAQRLRAVLSWCSSEPAPKEKTSAVEPSWGRSCRLSSIWSLQSKLFGVVNHPDRRQAVVWEGKISASGKLLYS